jgi:ABC-type uncharacterized transport system substrate-binding protein
MHFDRLKRRQFLTLVGGAAAWPVAARAQQAPLPVVAFIHGGFGEPLASYAAAFRKGLSEVGYSEGHNVSVEYHWLEGHYDRLPGLLADLIRRRVAVIATPGFTDGSRAAKAATTTIPIVFGVADDPVALGLVASLARPGGNATGINFFSQEINAKRLGLMRELLPKATRFAVLLNPTAASVAAVKKRSWMPRANSDWSLLSAMPARATRLTRPSPALRVTSPMLCSSWLTGSLPAAPCNSPCWRCASASRQASPHAHRRRPGS